MNALPRHTCQRCGHSWVPRTERKPVQCPNCKQPGWDRPARTKKETTMKRDYTGWTIIYGYDVSSLGDMTGYDEAESFERFGEMVESAIEAAYPGVSVRIKNRDYNGFDRPAAMRPGYDGEDTADEESIANHVEQIASRIFESGDWAVEPGHKHLCPACGKVTEEGEFDCELDKDHDYELCDECTAAGINLND